MKKLKLNTLNDRLNSIANSRNPDKIQEALVNVIFASLNGTKAPYEKVRDTKEFRQSEKAFVLKYTAFDLVKDEDGNKLLSFDSDKAKQILADLGIEAGEDSSFSFDALALALPMFNAKDEKPETPLACLTTGSIDKKVAKFKNKAALTDNDAIGSQVKLLEKQLLILKAQLSKRIQAESQADKAEEAKKVEENKKAAKAKPSEATKPSQAKAKAA